MLKRSIWGLALFLVLLSACTEKAPESAVAEAQPVPAITTVPEAESVVVLGMSNTIRVGNLLFGGQPAQSTFKELVALGYRTVLTVRGTGELDWDEKALAEEQGMRFIEIPMDNPVEAITDEQMDAFDAAMQSIDIDQPAVLHCGSGNRVAGLWGAWLAERQGMAPEEALKHAEAAGMTRVRPIVEKRLGLVSADSE